MSAQFKRVRHPLSIVSFRGWTFGRDPRRKGGQCLVSPRGSVFEMLVFKGMVLARKMVTD